MFRCIVADPPWHEAGGGQKGVQEMATNEPMADEQQAFAVAGFRSVFDQRFLFADEQRRIVELAERLLAENQRLRAREQALEAENAAMRSVVPVMAKPCFFHNATAVVFVLTTILNCIARKPSPFASRRECSHIRPPMPLPRAAEATM